MIRGISFRGNDADALFSNLDTMIDISKYEWYVDDVELNYFMCATGKYSGSEFRKALRELSNLSFVRIRRYPIGSTINGIDTYKDYLESNCDLLILFYDGGFFEIYTKDMDLICIIQKKCMDNSFEHVNYIDDNNDQRYIMHF